MLKNVKIIVTIINLFVIIPYVFHYGDIIVITVVVITVVITIIITQFACNFYYHAWRPYLCHFLELFCKVADNGLIRVDPMVVHFAGFEPGRSFSRKVELQNMSTDIQQMHIIPPQTKYFKIKYTKNVSSICYR